MWHNPQTHDNITHNPQDPQKLQQFHLRYRRGRFRDGDGWEGESGDEIERSESGEERNEKVRSKSQAQQEIKRKKVFFFFFLRKRKKEINKIM